MITNASSSSALLSVNVTGSPPYISPGSSVPMMGMVRWNPGRMCMEVYDGTMWHAYSQSLQVNLSPDVEATVRWAQKKQAEEAKLDELCRKHPGLQDAREQFEIMRRLCQESRD